MANPPTNSAVDLGTLKSHLWEAANILRGPVDASDFKTFIFPLLFFKHISDSFLRQRPTALLSLVERATGKQVTVQDSDEAKAAFGGSLVGQTQE